MRGELSASRQSCLAVMMLAAAGVASAQETSANSNASLGPLDTNSFSQSAAAPGESQAPPSAPLPSAPGAPPAAKPSDDVFLRARTLTDDRGHHQIVAEGDVEVRIDTRTLRADRVVYDTERKSLRAQGHVQISDLTGAIQFADEIEADDKFENGFATRFAARFKPHGTATASSAIRVEGTHNALDQAVYTGCPICNDNPNPTWTLRARRAVQDTDAQMISYRDVVLSVKGVPILYLPYLAHPDPTSDRHSGLLAPDFGQSSRLGFFYQQPYYWSISPSQDLTISPLLATNVNPLVELQWRKRFFSGYVDLKASVTYEKEFGSGGSKFGDDSLRSSIYGGGVFNINQAWKWGFGVERQSDDLYDLRYRLKNVHDVHGLFVSQPRQLLSQVYTVGQSKDFYLEAAALNFQGLRAQDDDSKFPTAAPTMFTERVFDLGQFGRIATDFSTAALFRQTPQTLPNGQITKESVRATVSADWRARYILPLGLVAEPFAQAREDAYKLDNGQTNGQHDLTRTLGLAGGQISWPIARHGQIADVVIEPIVMAAAGSSNANNANIPNEDSLVFEADESSLFSPNAVTSYDLYEGGQKMAAGVSANADFHNKVTLGVLAGRRWRTDADTSFNELSNLSGKKSDYVASVHAGLGKTIEVATRLRLDDNLTVNRVDVDSRFNYWRVSGAARYYRVASNAAGKEDEGISLGGQMQLSKHWAAVYSQNRNISQRLDTLRSLGLSYRDECSFFSIAYERIGTTDRSLGPSESIRFQFTFTGLGGTSTRR